jgi:hypothetical protein
MSTRCQTRIYHKGDDGSFGAGRVATFYRHCDGYPSGHGADLCNALVKAGDDVIALLSLLKIFDIELEPVDMVHGDVEYVYEVTLPGPYGFFPNGRPKPHVMVHHVRSNEVVYEGTPEDVRMEIIKDRF